MTFDLEALLANSRAYWLGWGREDADDTLYRSGVDDEQLNGVMRRDGRPFEEALADARARLAGCRGCGGSARTVPRTPSGCCSGTAPTGRTACR